MIGLGPTILRPAGRESMWALALLAGWLLMPAIGHAQAEETGGIGGTGLTTPTGEETGGIGGTGIGRGVPIVGYGPIQRFGSVFVNNREYRITGRTLVTINDRAATVAALRIGDIAKVTGETTGQHAGLALSISVRDALIGKVTAVSGKGTSFTMLGQRIVAATRGEPFAAVRAGETVAVSGQRQADGNWAAQRVSVTPADDRFRLEATITAVGAASITVAGTTIKAPKPFIANLHAGQRVTVTGIMRGSVLQARDIMIRPIMLGAPGTRVEVQNYFRTVADGRIIAADGMVATGAPSGAPLSGRRSVEIAGRLITPDTIAIRHLDVDTPVAPDLQDRATRHTDGAAPVRNQEPASGEAVEPQASPENEIAPPDDVGSPVEIEPPEVEEPATATPDVEPPDIEPPHVETPSPHIEPPEVDLGPDK